MSTPPSQVEFEGHRYPILAGDTVLDTLLRAGVSIAHGCRAGACHSCLLKTPMTPLPAISQRALSAEQIRAGCFLSCQLRPTGTLPVSRLEESEFAIPATVDAIDFLSPGVLRLTLQARSRWQAGQYFTLVLNDGTARCYSPVSSSRHAMLMEFHIRYRPDGKASSQLPVSLKPGDSLRLQGPFGHFTLADHRPDKPTVCIAQGTGLSPILALIEEHQHRDEGGELFLLAEGIPGEDSHYLQTHLQDLERKHSDVTVRLTAAGSDWVPAHVASLPALQGAVIYLCGDADFVNAARKACFMRGAAPRQIHSEVYLDFSDD